VKCNVATAFKEIDGPTLGRVENSHMGNALSHFPCNEKVAFGFTLRVPARGNNSCHTITVGKLFM